MNMPAVPDGYRSVRDVADEAGVDPSSCRMAALRAGVLATIGKPGVRNQSRNVVPEAWASEYIDRADTGEAPDGWLAIGEAARLLSKREHTAYTFLRRRAVRSVLVRSPIAGAPRRFYCPESVAALAKEAS